MILNNSAMKNHPLTNKHASIFHEFDSSGTPANNLQSTNTLSQQNQTKISLKA